MNTLLDRTFPRTSEQVLARLLCADSRVTKARLWLFEDQDRRREIESTLAAQGIEGHVHSAYKPLVHFFVEEVAPEGLAAVAVVYPVHPACHEARFRLEAYPLARMLPGVALRFEAAPPDEAATHPWYQVRLRYADETITRRVLAPNVLRPDFLGHETLSPSAWLITHEDGKTTHEPLASAYQQSFDAVMQSVAARDWGRDEPYFDRLVVRTDLPGIERPLGVGHEAISTTEAMHEELYFSLLEFFQHHAGRELGSRGLQPGQIIPDIRLQQEGEARVVVTCEPAVAVAESTILPTPQIAPGNNTLAQLPEAAAPLPQREILEATGAMAGEHFTFASRQQRPVPLVYLKGSKPAVLISGGQHANETTGVVGALRAAAELRGEPGAHLALMPLENPDGYALHEQLRAHHPNHMHHAARYSALGDDIEYREHAPWFERRARNHALAVSSAALHVNLHGYPAHEWTRPLTGYLPRGFELWSIPKGFFLILRYRPDSENKALALLEHVTSGLAENLDLMDYNARQLRAYRVHAGALPFQLLYGVPCVTTAVEDMACEVTLVTEFPDETIHGNDFVFGHTVQAETALAAARWWWR